ncbi:hypothetical protein [Reinekea marinisedimentorum]|uniref:DUF4386 family protein n=1 Tax=Reinekea marinisedimentorum TaxID=230495 RepID=A0A4R3IDD4_9GAMM|nr:hypothetical protein [Reinekea marinisedimentorum]TCS43776.1 hypothetical protein BCF53_101119 [Reinekea marinisedimentorum]
MKQLTDFGPAAALYAALAYIFALMIFALVLHWPDSRSDQILVLLQHPTLLHWLYVFVYQLWAIALLVLTLCILKTVPNSSDELKKLILVLASVWATLVAASGMLFNSGIAASVAAFEHNPEQAEEIWQSISFIANAIGGANEYIGGFWMLFVSIAMRKAALYSRGLVWLGFAIALAALATALPGLSWLGIFFGLSQIVWFCWLALKLKNFDDHS